MSIIIGLTGPAGAGKDTVGDWIVDNVPGFVKSSFADPMKKMLKIGLNLSDEQLWGDEKEIVDERYGCTPRHLMQTIGTDWGRSFVHPDIWVNAMHHHIRPGTVIADVRFENEARFIRQRGVLIHIGGRIDGVNTEKYKHASEIGVSVDERDLHLDNDGTFTELYGRLQDIKDRLVSNT
jgi:hypothetical protein